VVTALEAIINECKLLKPWGTLMALWSVLDVMVSCRGNRQVWKRIVGCGAGGIPHDIGQLMSACVDSLSEAEVAHLRSIAGDFKETAAELEDALAGFPLEDLLSKLGTSFP
jgi:hypothetical protein